MKKLLLAFGVFWVLSAFAATNHASAATACLGTGTNCSTTTQVQVSITGGDLCIGSPDGFFFWSFSVSTQPQTTTGVFNNYFYVDDQKGSSLGYYTTVQMATLTNGANTIASSNVSFRSSFTLGTEVGLTPLSGSVNTRVYTHTDTLNTWAALDTPKEFINRNTASNSGLVGKYGEIPFLQLVIPAYTPIGTYTGLLTYTLYEPV